MAEVTTTGSRQRDAAGLAARSSGPLPHARARRRYALVLGTLVVLAALCAIGFLALDNPMPPGSSGFWIIAQLRATTLAVIAVVVVCQAMATVSFQTVTNNRIITPSILGFEALYVAVQTTAVYVMGVAGVVALHGLGQFALQVALMVVFAVALFGWLLSGRFASLPIMLLVGIVLGGGLRSIATFMQRLLSPSEFDVLAARLFGNLSNAHPEYLALAVPLCVVASTLLWWRARRLNVIALGPDVSANLGLNHRRELMIVLVLVSVLMATSTALVGPMTFLGFLVATLAYQLSGTYDHRRILPVAILSGFVVLTGAALIMKHVFYAEGVVSIIVELVGGTAFLIVLLRKGGL